MNPKGRTLVFAALAFLAAPLIPAVTLPYLTPILSGPSYPRYDPVAILLFYAVSLHVGVIFGAPAFLILRKLNLARWWSGCIVGACIGGGFAFAFGGTNTPARVLFSLAGTGAAGALLFWIVWQARNNETQRPNAGTSGKRGHDA